MAVGDQREAAGGGLDRASDVSAQAKDRPKRRYTIRARAIVAALILVPAAMVFLVYSNWVAGGTGAIDSLISPAVAGLALFTAANHGLKRWRPSWAFSPGEVIAVYVSLVITVGLSADVWDWNCSVATVIAWPIWNASHENQWVEVIWPNLPSFLTVSNRDALAGFFMGESTPYQRSVVLAWLQPAIWWTAWATALLWVSLCLNVIVRRRWSREEQLPFPMTVLPLQMTEARAGLIQNPLWWTGAAISAGIVALGTIARFVPAVPTIPTSVSIETFITNNKPWDVLRTPTLGWDPWAIGLSYLMPVDLAFSMIVFNIFWRAEYVVTRVLGWTTSGYGGFPYGDQQTIGCYLGLMASVVWLDRRYLIQVFRKAIGLRSVADDSEEAFSYRLAVFGAVAGIVFLWHFLYRGGMSHAVAGYFLFLYFAMAMAMSRMRAHLGPPNHEMYGTMPEFALTEFPGTRALGTRALGTLAMMRPYMGEQRPNPAPAQLEALRMMERASVNPTPLAWLMIGIVPLGMLFYFWANLHFGYQLGLGTAKVSRSMIFVAQESSNKLAEWLRTPGGANWGGVGDRTGLLRHAGAAGGQAAVCLVAPAPGGLPSSVLLSHRLHASGHRHRLGGEDAPAAVWRAALPSTRPASLPGADRRQRGDESHPIPDLPGGRRARLASPPASLAVTLRDPVVTRRPACLRNSRSGDSARPRSR